MAAADIPELSSVDYRFHGEEQNEVHHHSYDGVSIFIIFHYKILFPLSPYLGVCHRTGQVQHVQEDVIIIVILSPGRHTHKQKQKMSSEEYIVGWEHSNISDNALTTSP